VFLWTTFALPNFFPLRGQPPPGIIMRAASARITQSLPIKSYKQKHEKPFISVGKKFVVLNY
jgi:hypothetical protein